MIFSKAIPSAIGWTQDFNTPFLNSHISTNKLPKTANTLFQTVFPTGKSHPAPSQPISRPSEEPNPTRKISKLKPPYRADTKEPSLMRLSHSHPVTRTCINLL